MDTEIITHDYFVMHYLDFLSMYIAHGNPSKDTLNHCRSNINQFIRWCSANGRHPLSINSYQMHLYLQYLNSRDYKKDTINGKIVDIRSFFMAAQKMELIEKNPCIGMTGGTSYSVATVTAADESMRVMAVRQFMCV